MKKVMRLSLTLIISAAITFLFSTCGGGTEKKIPENVTDEKKDSSEIELSYKSDSETYQKLTEADLDPMKTLVETYISNRNTFETMKERNAKALELINPACKTYFENSKKEYLNEMGGIKRHEFVKANIPYITYRLQVGKSETFNWEVTFECCKINSNFYFVSCHDTEKEMMDIWYSAEEIK